MCLFCLLFPPFWSRDDVLVFRLSLGEENYFKQKYFLQPIEALETANRSLVETDRNLQLN